MLLRQVDSCSHVISYMTGFSLVLLTPPYSSTGHSTVARRRLTVLHYAVVEQWKSYYNVAYSKFLRHRQLRSPIRVLLHFPYAYGAKMPPNQSSSHKISPPPTDHSLHLNSLSGSHKTGLSNPSEWHNDSSHNATAIYNAIDRMQYL
jgi:hypothetical protein